MLVKSFNLTSKLISIRCLRPRLQSTVAVGAPVIKSYSKPRMSAFRGGALGFLFGSTLAGIAGYYFLINDYQIASGLLLTSVKELQFSTEKVRDYARKIELVSTELKKLKETSAQLEDLHFLRDELRKLYNSSNTEVLDLKSTVTELEKELHDLQGSKTFR